MKSQPTSKPPVTRAHLDRARQLHVFADEAGPPTTLSRGNAGERQAADHLERIGIRIVERNFKTKLGELDIIAREGRTLVFVEVRSRSTSMFGSAVEAVNHHK
jgi:uncharacterized protein (TIGR00252 family)